MIKKQFLQISSEAAESRDSQSLPGDQRLWEALHKHISDFHSKRVQIIRLEWEADFEKAPRLSEWESVLGFKGLHSIKEIECFEGIALELNPLDAHETPLTGLVTQWLQLKGLHQVKVRCFEALLFFLDSGSPDTRPELIQILERVAALGKKSGLYSPDTTSCRVLPPQDRSLGEFKEALAIPAGDFGPYIRDCLQKNEFSFESVRFKISEKRPRTPLRSHNLEAIQRRQISAYALSDEDLAASLDAPLAVLLNFNPDPRFSLQSYAAFAARGVGPLALHEQEGSQSLDVFSIFPDHGLRIGPPATSKHHLFMLAPWNIRNPFVQQQVKFWLKQHDLKGFVSDSEIVSGRCDWIKFFTQIITQCEGWEVPQAQMSRLVQLNQNRTPSQRCWFFWSTLPFEDLKKRAQAQSLELLYLGKSTPSAQLQISTDSALKDTTLLLSDLKADLENEDVYMSLWEHPEERSPSYGFERAALFPDQFLSKVSERSLGESSLIPLFKEFASDFALRSYRIPRVEANPSNSFRYVSQGKVWADALSRDPAWAPIDPRQNAIVVVDHAVRKLLCLGVDSEQGMASFWMNHPEEPPYGGNQSEWAMWSMGIEGIQRACDSFKLKLHSLNFAPQNAATTDTHVFCRLQKSIDHEFSLPFPGFRMNGEVVYAVGPRPAFVDAGSKILSHVRVGSNHQSVIDIPQQLELYRLILECIKKGMISSMRSVSRGGVADCVSEMCLWGNLGIQIRPNLSPIELFSGAPGRIVVGILPQESKNFERIIPNEICTWLGTTGTEKVLGLPLKSLRDSRLGA